MADFVQLWVYLSSTPLFGLTATLLVYCLAQAIHHALGAAAWANPVLISVLILGFGITATGVAYPTYFAGAQFIHFLLGPAVVALGYPLWLRRRELLRSGPALLAAALLGGGAAAGTAGALAAWMGLPEEVLLSLVPKSVTAPVAMGIAQAIGGQPALSAVFAVVTGMIGALSGAWLFPLLGLGRSRQHWRIRGFAIGTAAHGIGAARAMQVDADAGAYAGLALAVQVLLAAILIPLALTLLR
ncbi:MAG: LrgB family protein [Burkholderiaceae bacterium]